jgi:hypothetical protein
MYSSKNSLQAEALTVILSEAFAIIADVNVQRTFFAADIHLGMICVCVSHNVCQALLHDAKDLQGDPWGDLTGIDIPVNQKSFGAVRFLYQVGHCSGQIDVLFANRAQDCAYFLQRVACQLLGVIDGLARFSVIERSVPACHFQLDAQGG